jgi:DNA-binding NarL/FixJ family response regulator
VVRRARGEIDTDVLATAMANLPSEIQTIFYRNNSRRASALVAEQLGARRGSARSKIEASAATLRSRIGRPCPRGCTPSMVGQLPSDGRRLYVLYYVDGLSVRQIATELERPEGTVRYLLHGLRQQIKRILDA